VKGGGKRQTNAEQQADDRVVVAVANGTKEIAKSWFYIQQQSQFVFRSIQ
jgi:hypothetical protein